MYEVGRYHCFSTVHFFSCLKKIYFNNLRTDFFTCLCYTGYNIEVNVLCLNDCRYVEINVKAGLVTGLIN